MLSRRIFFSGLRSFEVGTETSSSPLNPEKLEQTRVLCLTKDNARTIISGLRQVMGHEFDNATSLTMLSKAQGKSKSKTPYDIVITDLAMQNMTVLIC